MGKISDAFERQERENLLRINMNLRNEEKELVGLKRVRTEKARTVEAPEPNRPSGKLVVVSAPESADAENFRILRTHIFSSRNGERPRILMVTSAFPAEGKSFVASNLAASIALGTDERVLLIDADLRRPNQHLIFGCKKREGLCEYLDKRTMLGDVIRETGIDRLSILPAGRVSAYPGESISSHQMEEFMQEVKNNYRNWNIIIDSTPSQITAGAKVISKYVDGIIFVVMAQKWPRREIQRSIDSLGKEKILGVIFNGYAQANRNYRKYYDRYYGRK